MGMRSPRRSSDRLQPSQRPRRDIMLEAAIDNGRFKILFQPQIDPITGAVAGAEALARWDGVESDDELFERAAAGRLDERLSRTLQRRALEIAARWNGPLEHLTLSLNILPQD